MTSSRYLLADAADAQRVEQSTGTHHFFYSSTEVISMVFSHCPACGERTLAPTDWPDEYSCSFCLTIVTMRRSMARLVDEMQTFLDELADNHGPADLVEQPAKEVQHG